jgi:NADH:ubiquinone reductase (non-electrogenic)
VSTPGLDDSQRDFTLPYDKLVIAVGAINNTFGTQGVPAHDETYFSKLFFVVNFHAGTPGVEQNCLFLKEIDDAMAIRNKMLDCLELASLPSTSEEEKKRLLHFVVVGGGPTGVEAAAELRGARARALQLHLIIRMCLWMCRVDFMQSNVHKWFPKLESYVSITLVELMDHILSTYDDKISACTRVLFGSLCVNSLLTCIAYQRRHGVPLQEDQH